MSIIQVHETCKKKNFFITEMQTDMFKPGCLNLTSSVFFAQL